MSCAERLKSAMERRKVDSPKLSKMTGIDVGLINRYLRGEVDIGLKNGVRLSRALRVKLDALVVVADVA